MKKESPCFISGNVSIVDNSLTLKVDFINPLEENKLSLIDIDLEELKTQPQKHNIGGRYIEPFLIHCSELLSDSEEIRKEVTKILKELKIPDFKISLEDKEISGTKYILMKLTGEGSKSGKEFTMGLNLTDKNVLLFETAFFDSEFGVKIPSKTSLKNELE